MGASLLLGAGEFEDFAEEEDENERNGETERGGERVEENEDSEEREADKETAGDTEMQKVRVTAASVTLRKLEAEEQPEELGETPLVTLCRGLCDAATVLVAVRDVEGDGGDDGLNDAVRVCSGDGETLEEMGADRVGEGERSADKEVSVESVLLIEAATVGVAALDDEGARGEAEGDPVTPTLRLMLAVAVSVAFEVSEARGEAVGKGLREEVREGSGEIDSRIVSEGAVEAVTRASVEEASGDAEL